MPIASRPEESELQIEEDIFDHYEKAQEMIAENNLLPYPKTYALWYAYVTGKSPLVTQEVNAAIASNEAISTPELERIYDEYLSPNTPRNTEKLRDNIRAELKGALANVDTAVSQSKKYSAELLSVSDPKSEKLLPENLLGTLATLVQENEQMTKATQDLNSSLEKSQKQMVEINKQLDQLRHENLSDALTGVSNRRAFDLRIETEVKISHDTAKPLCLCMVDIDHFKKINDTYGHAVGDEVLKYFGRALKQGVKGRDMVARYGGEEFAIILPDTDIADAHKLMTQLKTDLARISLKIKNSDQRLGNVTASFGLAACAPELDHNALIERADGQLYEAKSGGRNCVKSYGYA